MTCCMAAAQATARGAAAPPLSSNQHLMASPAKPITLPTCCATAPISA